jgi:hypothetical protein
MSCLKLIEYLRKGSNQVIYVKAASNRRHVCLEKEMTKKNKKNILDNLIDM